MAIEETIEQVLTRAVPRTVAGTETVAEGLDRLTAQMRQLQTVNQAALESARTNSQVVVPQAARSTGTGSGGSTASSALLSFLGAGLGLSPLLSGMLRLFSGGGEGQEPPSPVKFALPAARSVSAGVSGPVGQAFAVDYGQNGLPRAVTVPQITVQVQAMDSRSFLDHSQDIALAVRQAMLESSVLSDVVREA